MCSSDLEQDLRVEQCAVQLAMRVVDAVALAQRIEAVALARVHLARQRQRVDHRAEVALELVEFISGAELVIHNADFDIEFLNHELRRLPGMPQEIRSCCGVLDTLALARKMHPGQRNSLDALAKRYNVDNSKRELHGALLDAQILADIYLAMTGGQVSLSLDSEAAFTAAANPIELRFDRRGLVLPVLAATPEEQRAHEAMLAVMAKKGQPLWRELEQEAAARAAPAAAA